MPKKKMMMMISMCALINCTRSFAQWKWKWKTFKKMNVQCGIKMCVWYLWFLLVAIFISIVIWIWINLFAIFSPSNCNEDEIGINYLDACAKYFGGKERRKKSFKNFHNSKKKKRQKFANDFNPKFVFENYYLRFILCQIDST